MIQKQTPRGAEQGGKLAAKPAEASPSWRSELAAAIRDVDTLWQRLQLPPAALPQARAAAASFPLLVTHSFVDRMQVGDLDDPLLQQVLPIGDELATVPGFGCDPVGELDRDTAPGLVQKYHGRALLICTGACAVHCRYCFRRHYPYERRPRGRAWWSDACAQLQADPSIEEIILSGGDPLTLPDAELAALTADLAAIPHLKRLRIHTRLPIVLPSRVTDSCVSWLSGSRLDAVVVMHSNHANELDESVRQACSKLQRCGIPLLNQAVLLKGINDTVVNQLNLSRRLIAMGIVPYYLHVLDRVAGAAHFAVPDSEAQQLLAECHQVASGYLVPRLVREEAGTSGKTLLPWMSS